MYLTAVILYTPEKIEEADDISNAVNGMINGDVEGKIIIKHSLNESQIPNSIVDLMLESEQAANTN